MLSVEGEEAVQGCQCGKNFERFNHFHTQSTKLFQAALELALSVADPDAVTRYIERGVTMTFGDDLLLDFADSWKLDDGLRYTNVRHP